MTKQNTKKCDPLKSFSVSVYIEELLCMLEGIQPGYDMHDQGIYTMHIPPLHVHTVCMHEFNVRQLNFHNKLCS